MEKIWGVHTNSLVPGLLNNLGRLELYQINAKVSYYSFKV